MKTKDKKIKNMVSRIIPLAALLLAATTLFGQYQITGSVTNENTGDPVPGVEVYFYIKGVGPLGGSMTDQDGIYRFFSDMIEINDIVHLQSWSYCDEHWEPYNFFFEIVSDSTTFSFQVCSDEEPCNADFVYETDSLEVEFLNQSSGPVYEVYWDFGDGEHSFEINPSHTYDSPGQYEVSLFISADNNCYDSKTELINVGQNYTISGTAWVGETPLPSGEVLLVEIIGLTHIRQRYTLDDSGEYEFSVEPFHEYLLYVLPDIDPGIPHFPVYMPTYYGDVMQWQESTPVFASQNIEADIHLQSYNEMFYGSGTIEGHAEIMYGDINDMPIFLKDESGNYVDFCYPETDGSFSFYEIPFSSYIIFPEKTGETTDPGFVSLSSDEPMASNVTIIEKENGVEVEYNVGLSILQKGNTRLYPVPANENFYIESDQKISVIQLFSMVGQQVYCQTINRNSYTVSIGGIQDGAYMLQVVFDDGHTHTHKIFIRH